MVILASLGVIVLIFIINVIPVFMPPTWALISLISFNFPLSNLGLALLSLGAALASSSGRAVLAIFSEKILRNKFIKPETRKNLDFLKERVERKRVLTFGFFLAFAFSPLPSGQLFLAYGLTNLKLYIAIIPFFVGRLVSYLFWAFTASGLSDYLKISASESGTFFSLYFIIGQIVTLYLVYVFTKIDWQALLEEKKLRFIRSV
jgi:hypothetical protein